MNDFNKNGYAENSIKSDSDFSEISTDGIFSIKVTEDMGIRNILRSGLVEAQGKDGDKVPMFVSWPHWLDDGIVCLFARDLHSILADTVRNIVITINKDLETTEIGESINDQLPETVFEVSPDGDKISQETVSNNTYNTETISGQEVKVKENNGENILPSRSKIIKGSKF